MIVTGIYQINLLQSTPYHRLVSTQTLVMIGSVWVIAYMYIFVHVDVNLTTYNTIDVQLICGLMVNIIILRSVDCRFEFLTSQNKDCKIGICCFSAKHPVLRSKSRYLILLPAYNLKRNQLQNKIQFFTNSHTIIIKLFLFI